MAETVKHTHTDGPWVIDPRYPSEVQTTNLKTVATCWYENLDGQEIIIRDVVECSREESAANARLISAAPELLDALKLVMTWIKNWDPNFSEDDEWCDQDRPKIDAAIAKAEGRS